MTTTHITKVLVSGCFDMLHSGHIQFLQQAAEYGQLYVALGSDETIHGLKGRYPYYPQNERLFMLQSLRCVHQAFIATGTGLLDFEAEFRFLQPDYFVVNDDGDNVPKRELCRELGVRYRLLQRQPAPGLPARCTTALRSRCRIPYRIDLAGGWLDQPFVSKFGAGPVIVLGLEPGQEFQERSGMATSTRSTAKQVWGDWLPNLPALDIAKILFACENPPGKAEISGSQDVLGIALPGVSRLDYASDYWPEGIESSVDSAILDWLQTHMFFRWLGPRPANFNVLAEMRVEPDLVGRLSAAARDCWKSIQSRDLGRLGATVRASFEAQVAMFPGAVTETVATAIGKLPQNVLGHKLAGAGGGGYLFVVAEERPEGFEPIVVRAES